MGKKSLEKKLTLGRYLKRNRRIPIMAIGKSHRRLQYNLFQRNWRRSKLRIKR